MNNLLKHLVGSLNLKLQPQTDHSNPHLQTCPKAILKQHSTYLTHEVQFTQPIKMVNVTV